MLSFIKSSGPLIELSQQRRSGLFELSDLSLQRFRSLLQIVLSRERAASAAAGRKK